MARADQRTQKILYKALAEIGIPQCRSSDVPAPQFTGTHVCFRSHRDGEVTLILKAKDSLGGALDCVVFLKSLAISISTTFLFSDTEAVEALVSAIQYLCYE